MTLALRRLLLSMLFIFAFIAMFATGLAWIGVFRGDYASHLVPPSITTLWWGIVRNSQPDEIINTLSVLSFYVLLGFVGELILRRRFGRNPSTEMFYLRLFLLILPLQVVRLIIPLVFDGMYGYYIGVASTRIAWFGRLVGIIALLNVGLYSSDLPIRGSGYILGIGALSALAVAIIIPVDMTQPMGNLLYRTGSEVVLALSCISLEILSLLCLLGSGIKRMNNQYYLLTLFLALMCIAYELSFFGVLAMAVPGAFLMIIGIVGFSWVIQSMYQSI